MMYADLNHLLRHPGLIHSLRRENADGDVLMALITDGPSPFMTLHFASAKLQKLYFKTEREWGFKPRSGTEVTRSVWMCMALCHGEVERALRRAGTVGAIDSTMWPAVVLSTTFNPGYRAAPRLHDIYVEPKKTGHLRLISSND